jgi:hypothetical protein
MKQTKIGKLLEESGKWSGDVETHWTPPEGLFTKSGEDIASTLLSKSDSPGQAMSRLNFYINRAGGNLPADRKGALDRAKEIIHKKVEEK